MAMISRSLQFAKKAVGSKNLSHILVRNVSGRTQLAFAKKRSKKHPKDATLNGETLTNLRKNEKVGKTLAETTGATAAAETINAKTPATEILVATLQQEINPSKHKETSQSAETTLEVGDEAVKTEGVLASRTKVVIDPGSSEATAGTVKAAKPQNLALPAQEEVIASPISEVAEVVRTTDAASERITSEAVGEVVVAAKPEEPAISTKEEAVASPQSEVVQEVAEAVKSEEEVIGATEAGSGPIPSEAAEEVVVAAKPEEPVLYTKEETIASPEPEVVQEVAETVKSEEEVIGATEAASGPIPSEAAEEEVVAAKPEEPVASTKEETIASPEHDGMQEVAEAVKQEEEVVDAARDASPSGVLEEIVKAAKPVERFEERFENVAQSPGPDAANKREGTNKENESLLRRVGRWFKSFF